MEQDQPRKKQNASAQTREDRLKAALKANMGRRKAQARARAVVDQAQTDDKSSEG
ncbi:MAG: hypothetical protein OQK05_12050 [Pseudopelagicola sp.]|nr:hypothetical protein [Pseudopelagicola sp.]